MVDKTFATYLGKKPVCDICRKPIKMGQTVTQVTTGKVAIDKVDISMPRKYRDEVEFGLISKAVHQFHIDCFWQRN